jgi:hypothetical protein
MKMTLLPAIAALVACGSRVDNGVDASLDASEGDSASDAGEAAVPVGDPICTPRSGTRIKVRWYQSAEGTLVFDSMYDSMLDVRCQAALTSDGKVRCLPLEQLSGVQWYSDAQCTMPAMPIRDDCYLPAYAAVNANPGCPTTAWGGIQQTFSVYRVDAAQADAGPGFVASSGACVADNSAPTGTLYAVTAVADTEFAEGTLGQVTAGRYSMATVDFSDGAHYCGVYDGFYDSTLDVSTFVFGSLDQSRHLLPNVPGSNAYADSTCMAPATGVSSDTCADARFALRYDYCSGVTVYSVGAALDAGFQQELQPDGGYGCNPVTYAMQTWHAVDAFPQSAIGQVVRHPVGAGRLQYLTYEADGQFRWRQGAAFDSQTGTPCMVSGLSGATTRCLPTPALNATTHAFSDANCTQPIYVVNLPSCAAPGANTIASAYDTCQRVKIVHVGPQYNGVVYRGSGGTCFLSSPPPGTVAYQGIDDIDQAMYPELTAVVE